MSVVRTSAVSDDCPVTSTKTALKRRMRAE
jgi:hypothetical protein